MVSKLDRLSRSVHDFSGLLEKARKEGWGLMVVDLGIDTLTPPGELVANVTAATSQYERRMIGARTREALAIRKAQGVRLGRPPSVPPGVRERIRSDRKQGKSLRQIAAELNRDEIPTAQGGRQWYPATIAAVVRSATTAQGKASGV